MDGGKFAQVLTGLPGVTAAAQVLVGAGSSPSHRR